MASEINKNVRIQMLGTNDSTILSDDYLDLLESDAAELTGISDTSSTSLRYYICYLVASNWESIGAIDTREGVKYKSPDPQKYLDLYNKSLSQSISTENGNVFAEKVSTDRSTEFNEDGLMVRKYDSL